MPILEYVCQSCESSFDKFVRGYDNHPAQAACPSCGAEAQRKISAVGITGVWQSKTPEFTIPKMAPPSPDDPFNCIV